jgi:protein-S-isoprenylcysteine O-methyltransferase Ste14
MKKTLIQKFRIPSSIFIGAMFFLLMMFSNTAWNDKDSIFPGVFFFLGIILVGLGSFGRLWSGIFIAGRKTKNLISEGPYSMTRNPLYFFSFIGFIGVGLCTETLLAPLLLAIAFACYYPLVIRNEEAKLRMVHGEKFESYAKLTPRFFPKISNFKQSATHTIYTKNILTNFADTMLFPVCVGALEFIEHLHRANIFPYYFNIY